MMKLILLILALVPSLALADPWGAFREPGVVALMRHATAPGGGDPRGFRLEDCATQRNLSEAGRAEARAIGARFREAGIAFDAVYTSQWCRTRDTAMELGLGAPIDAPHLNSFFADRSTGPAQTAETLAFIAANPGKRLLLVTHQVNITALTSITPRSGEIVLTRPSNGRLTVVTRLPPP
jgi:phosphohistidine phosphatase SixA